MPAYQDKRTERWFYQFEFKGHVYKKQGFDSAHRALAAEGAKRAELALLGPIEPLPPSMDVATYWAQWMGDHVRHQCRPRIMDEYAGVYRRHIGPRIGKVRLKDLKRTQIKQMFADIDGLGLARSTIRNILIPLRAMLNAARDDGYLETNPADRLRRSGRAKHEADSETVASYTRDELAAIVAGLNDWPHPYALLLKTICHSGMRLSEASGLRPGDLMDGYIWVKRGIQYSRGRLDVYAPKSGKARRVDMPLDTLASLRKIPTDDWIFGHARKAQFPARADDVRDQWKAFLAKHGIRPLRVHDLRHTYACLLLQRGAPIPYVMEQLGHSSIQVTVDIYGHMIPGENRKWIDDAFGA